jgi:hypothetical protein
MIGHPSMTPSRPITTDEITITTPTERSMPAVRITKVWAMPSMPVIVTCVSTVERLRPVANRSKSTVTPSRSPSSKTTKGTTVG